MTKADLIEEVSRVVEMSAKESRCSRSPSDRHLQRRIE